MKDQNEKPNDVTPVASDALLDALRYVANECQRNPMDSVKDILNEAFDDYGLPLYAEWSDDPDRPISIRI